MDARQQEQFFGFGPHRRPLAFPVNSRAASVTESQPPA